MQAVKQVFSYYVPLRERQDFCDVCISDDFFLEFQQAIDHPETAEPWVYEYFFHEDIDCVGTINNLKFWLPRTLETSLLDYTKSFTFEIFEKYQSQNIGFWPNEETHALRQVFSRALIGVVENNDAAPLGPKLPQFISKSYETIRPASFSLQVITGILIALRVDPKDIFQYVYNHHNETIDYFLADLILVGMSPWWIGDLDKGLPENFTDFDKANIFLDQNAMFALLDVVSKDYLNQQLAQYQLAKNNLLVEEISLALKYYDREKNRIPLISQQEGESIIFTLLADKAQAYLLNNVPLFLKDFC